jgi:RNA polymerase sigma-70 factor (ECF subfamily)
MGAVVGFDEFYRGARNRCYRAILASIGDSDAAAEAMAEAMVRALARWDRLSSHPNPEAWVVRTAVNVHRSWWRRWRRSLTLRPDRDAVPDVAAPFDEDLLGALRDLPRRQREVVALRVLLDLSTNDTAAELKIAPGTVTAHLHRALEHLRRALNSAGDLKEDRHGIP